MAEKGKGHPPEQEPAPKRRGRAAILLVLSLSFAGAIGHLAAEGWPGMEFDARPAPPVASWQGKIPALDEANAAQVEPAAGGAGEPSPLPEIATRREFTDAPDVVEPEQQPQAPAVPEPRSDAPGRPQLAALTPGPDLKPGAPPRAGDPRIGDGPTATWRLNAVPFADKPGLKLVAIIIDDAGVDRARTARALRLAGPLTISFLPYAGDVQRQAEEARRRGHELMVHLPMEPLSAQENPGPDALTTRLPRPELMRRLAANLQRFDGYVGVNNHMGSRMTADANALLPVLEELREQGLLFVDSRTTKDTVAGLIAGHLGLASASRDVFIDHEDRSESVAARLADIERIARRMGQAVAIGHPHDRTLDALERWLPGLAERGFTLAPVSAVVLRRQEGRMEQVKQ